MATKRKSTKKRANAGDAVKQVAFTTDKLGRPIAYRVSMKQMRNFRIGLDAAKLMVSTGKAVRVPYRTFGVEKKNPAAKRANAGYLKRKSWKARGAADFKSGQFSSWKDAYLRYRQRATMGPMELAEAEEKFYNGWEGEKAKKNLQTYFSLNNAGKKKRPAKKTKSNRSNPGVWHPLTDAEDAADARGLVRELTKLAKRDKQPQTYRAKKYGNTWTVEVKGLANPGRKRRRNPGNVEDEAAELYRDFHGEDPDVVIDVATPIYEHSTLSGLGKLKALVIKAAGSPHLVTISGFGGAILCRPPRKADRPQLYIEGGDQAVNLKDFGIKTEHEVEILGAVHEIVYHTNKTHLVPEDGGRGNYGHKFKTSRDGDTHIKIQDGRYPVAVYNVRNRTIQIAGGSYTIPGEGISG